MATTPAPAGDEIGQGQTTSQREPRPDIRITSKVEAKLLTGDHLTGIGIMVSIQGAIVQLAGWVKEPELAWRTPPSPSTQSNSARLRTMTSRRQTMTQEGLQRRTMLRNLAAVCCALCLPEMAGCSKKPPSPESSSPPGGAATPPATESGMAAQPGPAAAEATPGKLAQAAVQYQDHPKGDESCSSCMHFIPESNSCKLVAGPISPQGWCTIWAKKMA